MTVHQTGRPRRSDSTDSCATAYPSSSRQGHTANVRREPALADLHRAGYAFSVATPTLVLSLGTTAGLAVERAIWRLQTELGSPELSQHVAFRTLDSVASASPWAGQVGASVDGNGTDPCQGRRTITDPETFLNLRSYVADLMHDLRCPETRWPELAAMVPAAQTVDVYLLAGAGGTSGGFLQPMIDLVHQAAADACLRRVQIHVCLVGPLIVLGDPTRPIDPRRRQIIQSTYATNAAALEADAADPTVVTIRTPDGLRYTIRRSQRVQSHTIFDQGNGRYDLRTVGDAMAMLGDELFLRLFTPLGNYLAQRLRDPRQTNSSAQTTPRSERPNGPM